LLLSAVSLVLFHALFDRDVPDVRFAGFRNRILLAGFRIPDFEIFSAVYRTPFTNGTLDLDEIWHDCAVGYGTHSCQISSESNLPFVRYYGRTEPRQLAGSRRLMSVSVRRRPFSNGSSDRLEILRVSSEYSAASACLIWCGQLLGFDNGLLATELGV
jgi:hypothetical protein